MLGERRVSQNRLGIDRKTDRPDDCNRGSGIRWIRRTFSRNSRFDKQARIAHSYSRIIRVGYDSGYAIFDPESNGLHNIYFVTIFKMRVVLDRLIPLLYKVRSVDVRRKIVVYSAYGSRRWPAR